MTEQIKSHEKRKELIYLGILVKCKNCEDRLMSVNDKFNGFCSQRCSKISDIPQPLTRSKQKQDLIL